MNRTTRFLLPILFLISLPLFSQEDQLDPSIENGAKIYKKKCAVCHSKKGTGKGKRIPPLAQSDYLQNNISESIKAIKYGMKGEIVVNGTTYNREMQSVDLSDQEIADVMNYVLNSWGNKSEVRITADRVADSIKK